jgi:hypothetical protein
VDHTVLQFDYDEVLGATLAKAEGIAELRLDDGTKAYDSIRLLLEGGSFINIQTTENTDEIAVEYHKGHAEYYTDRIERTDVSFMSEYRGLPLGWCWIGTNYRGYKDVFLLSFAGVDPQLAFVACASKIHCYRLAQG